jgi:hypothetical protein
MQRSQTYRWAARLGGFALTLAFAFPMVFSEVEPAEAQSPVCFTIHGKCFCVDFFLTEVRDMAWGKVQDEIASLYDDFFTQQLDTQVRDVLALIRHPEELLDWRSYGSQVQTVLSVIARFITPVSRQKTFRQIEVYSMQIHTFQSI